jgi:hypothetical protein
MILENSALPLCTGNNLDPTVFEAMQKKAKWALRVPWKSVRQYTERIYGAGNKKR